MSYKNPTFEWLEDHKKLIIAFKDDDMISKIFMIGYKEDDLVNVFYDTTRKVIEAISSKYDTKTAIHIYVLVQQYNSCMMKKYSSIIDHINKMMVMANDLIMIGNVISKLMHIFIILNNLHFRT